MPEPKMIRVLKGERIDPPPVWIMRQAGRYLPEFKATRKASGSFLNACYTPDVAVELVLQPMRRFDLDAAILFSDILVVPDALGRKVEFLEGVGPRLESLADEAVWDMGDADRVVPFLSPVYEAVRRLRAQVPADKALFGFAGAPWTVATYMIQGKGGDKDVARRVAYERPAEVDALLALLVEATARHLHAQAQAGADCLQIFESWAEGLPEPLFERVILRPTTALMKRLRELGVDVPVVGFPRGAGALIGRYARETGVDALGVDTMTPAAFAREQAPPGMPLQGNLDPMLLVCGGEALEREAKAVIEAFRGSPHVFNLGHGITPDASPEHLARLIAVIKGVAA